jgi:glycerol uptake facilitator-like aquaporin
MQRKLHQRLLSEPLGTTLLLAVVIGSGIMGERLSGGNHAIALLANTAATVGGLYILIEMLRPISGAHFNPAVTLVMATRGELPKVLLMPYVASQLIGAVLGAWLRTRCSIFRCYSCLPKCAQAPVS